jgi:hypothetical protein
MDYSNLIHVKGNDHSSSNNLFPTGTHRLPEYLLPMTSISEVTCLPVPLTNVDISSYSDVALA